MVRARVPGARINRFECKTISPVTTGSSEMYQFFKYITMYTVNEVDNVPNDQSVFWVVPFNESWK